MAGWIALAVLLLVLIGYLWWEATADQAADRPATTPEDTRPPAPRRTREAEPRPRRIIEARRGNASTRPGVGPMWLVTSDEHLTLHGDTHGRYVLVDERSRARSSRRGRVPP